MRKSVAVFRSHFFQNIGIDNVQDSGSIRSEIIVIQSLVHLRWTRLVAYLFV